MGPEAMPLVCSTMRNQNDIDMRHVGHGIVTSNTTAIATHTTAMEHAGCGNARPRHSWLRTGVPLARPAGGWVGFFHIAHECGGQLQPAEHTGLMINI